MPCSVCYTGAGYCTILLVMQVQVSLMILTVRHVEVRVHTGSLLKSSARPSHKDRAEEEKGPKCMKDGARAVPCYSVAPPRPLPHNFKNSAHDCLSQPSQECADSHPVYPLFGLICGFCTRGPKLGKIQCKISTNLW